jgi:hypothetical protein
LQIKKEKQKDDVPGTVYQIISDILKPPKTIKSNPKNSPIYGTTTDQNKNSRDLPNFPISSAFYAGDLGHDHKPINE